MPNISNVPAEHAEALDFARLAGNNWRTGRSNAKKLAKRIVVLVTTHNFAQAELLKDVRKQMADVPAEDRNNVDRFFSDVRKIIDNWSDIPATLRADYLKADAPTYSTLIADIKARDAAAKKAQKEADAKRAAEEAGLSETDYAASIARKGVSDANMAAVELVLALLDNADRTADESAALAKLLDGVTAYQSATLNAMVA